MNDQTTIETFTTGNFTIYSVTRRGVTRSASKEEDARAMVERDILNARNVSAENY